MARIRTRKQKYIAYINMEYLRTYFVQVGAFSPDKQREIRRNLYDSVDAYLKADNTAVLYIDKFVSHNGKLLPSVEIIPLSNLGQIWKDKRKRKHI